MYPCMHMHAATGRHTHADPSLGLPSLYTRSQHEPLACRDAAIDSSKMCGPHLKGLRLRMPQYADDGDGDEDEDDDGYDDDDGS